ncbi:hypothetical protein [Paracoccus sp. (in: a-proteobacteria)]|uniref:hypothetical protein n=1 Tax=Paracoccus sp. TaxID=267 RepID=UPI0026DFF0F5|nr:hypothetical protein [Paracoccus sp. (in: a-proteobacteria)]MDO5369796.1 hypothetical protein [Paracoccus sp. (in: a-proteobacteria)]
MRLLRVIIFLAVAGVIALVGYAYFGDMTADPRPIHVPVELDLNLPPATAPAAAPAVAPAVPQEQDDPDALD